MDSYLRLRQICLVSRDLERVAADVQAILGLQICHRDPHLAAYGLENVIFPVGTCFMEVVAPVRPATAAERFLDRSGGRGGYMVIFDCDDPKAWRHRAEDMEIAVANTIHQNDYHSVQLHPRDCRAAMIEFGHTEGGGELAGPYGPAGENWQAFVSTRQAQALTAIELESRRPHDLARHWSRLLDVPVERKGTGSRLTVGDQTIWFVPGAAERERFSAVHVTVADRASAERAARDRGYRVEADTFRLSGVDFRLIQIN